MTLLAGLRHLRGVLFVYLLIFIRPHGLPSSYGKAAQSAMAYRSFSKRPQSSKNKGTGYVFQGNNIYEQWRASRPAGLSAEKPYIVFVDYNFHYMDESERYKQGEYATFQGAVKACQMIIDDCLSGLYKPGMSSKELFDGYVLFGEDPFICGQKSDFSAWDYARRRCEALCNNPIDDRAGENAGEAKPHSSCIQSERRAVSVSSVAARKRGVLLLPVMHPQVAAHRKKREVVPMLRRSTASAYGFRVSTMMYLIRG